MLIFVILYNFLPTKVDKLIPYADIRKNWNIYGPIKLPPKIKTWIIVFEVSHLKEYVSFSLLKISGRRENFIRKLINVFIFNFLSLVFKQLEQTSKCDKKNVTLIILFEIREECRHTHPKRNSNIWIHYCQWISLIMFF